MDNPLEQPVASVPNVATEGAPQSYKPAIIGAVSVTVLIIALLVGWYFYSLKSAPSVGEEEIQTGLGSELFETVDNPVEDQIPSVPTSVNPLDTIYKNPFE